MFASISFTSTNTYLYWHCKSQLLIFLAFQNHYLVILFNNHIGRINNKPATQDHEVQLSKKFTAPHLLFMLVQHGSLQAKGKPA